MSDKKLGTAHLFACYTDSIYIPAHAENGSHIKIEDSELAHRLYTILRMQKDDLVQLFDGMRVLTIKVNDASKKNTAITGTVLEHHMIMPRTPLLTVGIGMLKKDHLEHAVYSAAQMGAATIVPLITEKSRQRWSSPHECERLEKIIISACEQSKNFCIPALTQPLTLTSFIQMYPAEQRLYFESHGQPLTNLIGGLHEKKTASISITVGPEGGFVPDEVKLLEQNNTHAYSLTPTILRAHDAVCVGVGTVSSVIYREG